MKGNEQIELKAQRYLYERAHLSGSCVVTTFDPFDLEQAFIDGAEWQYEQFEKNRLAACDNMTKEEAEREQEFTTDFIEKNNRIPTYSDAIEYGRESMKEKLTKLEEMANKMYYAAQYLTTDASKLRKAMRDYWYYVVYELKKE